MSDNTQEMSESESRECMNTNSETYIKVYSLYIKYVLASKVIMMT